MSGGAGDAPTSGHDSRRATAPGTIAPTRQPWSAGPGVPAPRHGDASATGAGAQAAAVAPHVLPDASGYS